MTVKSLLKSCAIQHVSELDTRLVSCFGFSITIPPKLHLVLFPHLFHPFMSALVSHILRAVVSLPLPVQPVRGRDCCHLLPKSGERGLAECGLAKGVIIHANNITLSANPLPLAATRLNTSRADSGNWFVTFSEHRTNIVPDQPSLA